MTEFDIDAYLKQVFEQSTKLRYKESKINPTSSYNDVMQERDEVKSRLDVLEEFILTLYRLREKAKRAVSAARAIRQDEWDKSLISQSNNLKSRMGDFQTGKERESNANVEVFEYTRNQRRLETQESKISEAYVYVKIIQDGLNEIRRDLRSIINTFQSDPTQPYWRKK